MARHPEQSDKTDLSVEEHRRIMSYLQSDEWHFRLSEAREKREKVLAERSAETDDAGTATIHHLGWLRAGTDRAPADDGDASPETTPASPRAQGPDAGRLPEPDEITAPVVDAPLLATQTDGATKADGPTPARPDAARRRPFLMAGIVCLTTALGFAAGYAVRPAGDAADPVAAVQSDSAPAGEAIVADPPAPTAVAAELIAPDRAETRPSAADLASTLRPYLDGRPLTLVAPTERPELVAMLEDAQADLVSIRETPFQVGQTSVHYFRPEDAEAAGLLAETLGGAVADLTGLRPAPPPGTLALHVADE